MNADAPQIRKWVARVRARHPVESARYTEEQIEKAMFGWLNLMEPLGLNEHEDQVRFVGLCVLLTPEQRRSPLTRGVLMRIMSYKKWPSHIRLDFVYKHLVGRPLSANEEDFGPKFAPL